MRKKLISLFMTMVLGCVLFTGCGEKTPTAEELLTNALSIENMNAIDTNVKAGLDAEMDNAAIIASIDAHVKLCDVEHSMNFAIDLAMEQNSDSTTLKREVSEYTIIDGNVAKMYSNSNGTGEWIVSERDTEEYKTECEESFGEVKETIANLLSPDIFSELSLDKKSEKGFYTVTGKVDIYAAAKKAGKTNEEVDELFEDLPENIAEKKDELVPNIVFKFDKKSKELKSVTLTFDTEAIKNALKEEEMEVVINNVSLELVFNQIGGDVKIEVPNEVKESAITENEYYESF